MSVTKSLPISSATPSKSVKLFNAEITISIASHHLTTLVYYLKNSKNWLIQNFKIRKLSGNVININLNINIHGASSTLEYCYNLPKRHCSQQIISGTPPGDLLNHISSEEHIESLYTDGESMIRNATDKSF